MQANKLNTDKILVAKTYSVFKKQVDLMIQNKQYSDAFLTCNKSIYFLGFKWYSGFFNLDFFKGCVTVGKKIK